MREGRLVAEHRYHPDGAHRRVTSHESYYEPPDYDDEFEDWHPTPLCDCGAEAETTYAGHPVCYRCAVDDWEHDEADRLRDEVWDL